MSSSEIPFVSLISGGGSTMEALGIACQNGGQLFGKAKLRLVIASTTFADGLTKARALGIPTKVLVRKDFPSDEVYGAAIITLARGVGVTHVLQNGWLPKTPANVIGAFPGRIFNQHPAPVPEFGGSGMYGRRLHFARVDYARLVDRNLWTHAVAQRVAIEFDAGEVLHRQEIKILPDDDPLMLQQRVLPFEHQVQIELLEMLFAGTLTPVKPHEPLARDIHEIMSLSACKKTAIRLFPHG